jgi:hypothetical protein
LDHPERVQSVIGIAGHGLHKDRTWSEVYSSRRHIEDGLVIAWDATVHESLSASFIEWIHQPRLFRQLADTIDQRAHVDDEIANALAEPQDSGNTRGMLRARQRIAEKRREQFELDCLREALGHRFFPAQAKPAKPPRCFDITITYNGCWWKVEIPEIRGITKTRRREDVEMSAREHIAVAIDARIAEVAIRVVDAS